MYVCNEISIVLVQGPYSDGHLGLCDLWELAKFRVY